MDLILSAILMCQTLSSPDLSLCQKDMIECLREDLGKPMESEEKIQKVTACSESLKKLSDKSLGKSEVGERKVASVDQAD